jgi:hypothetical protein
MIKNVAWRLLKGKRRVLAYWSRRLRTVAPGGEPRTVGTPKKPTPADLPSEK